MKTIFVCHSCGSPLVYADAFQSLNDPEEVIAYDHRHCMSCEGECSTESISVPLSFDTDEQFGVDIDVLSEWVRTECGIDLGTCDDHERGALAKLYWRQHP